MILSQCVVSGAARKLTPSLLPGQCYSAADNERKDTAPMSEQLVFIIGAGAGVDVGLPTGRGLIGQIRSAVDFNRAGGDDAIRNCISLFQHSDRRLVEVYWQACRRIVTALPQAQSIDNFIHENRSEEGIEFCGKLAIARCILNAERSSAALYIAERGFRKPSFEHGDTLGKSWYSRLFSLLIRYREPDELPERFKHISMIIFNYDRCIEHYLFHALENYYPIDYDKAAELLSHLRFFHPYGSVGKLRWQGGERLAAFGEDLQLSSLIDVAKDIRTFTEGTRADDVASLRRKLLDADKVVFLGFGFHELNMDLLNPDAGDRRGVLESPKQFFATAKGMSDYAQSIAALHMAKLAGVPMSGKPIIDAVCCAEFFDKYGMGFSIN